jgi:hypothetical protein
MSAPGRRSVTRRLDDGGPDPRGPTSDRREAYPGGRGLARAGADSPGRARTRPGASRCPTRERSATSAVQPRRGWANSDRSGRARAGASRCPTRERSATSAVQPGQARTDQHRRHGWVNSGHRGRARAGGGTRPGASRCQRANGPRRARSNQGGRGRAKTGGRRPANAGGHGRVNSGHRGRARAAQRGWARASAASAGGSRRTGAGGRGGHGRGRANAGERGRAGPASRDNKREWNPPAADLRRRAPTDPHSRESAPTSASATPHFVTAQKQGALNRLHSRGPARTAANPNGPTVADRPDADEREPALTVANRFRRQRT